MKKFTKENAKSIKSIVRVANKIGEMRFIVEFDEKHCQIVCLEERLTTDHITYPIYRSEGILIDNERITSGNFKKLTSNHSKCFDIIDTYFYLKSEGLFCEYAFWKELESRKVAA